MDLNLVLREAFAGSLHNVLKMAGIVIPLMMVMEVARGSRLMDRTAALFRPLMGLLGLSPAATFPLMVAQLFGLAYGAGLIIDYSQEGDLSPRENYLLNVFLSICHSLVEDTILFLVIGASFGVIVGVRVLIAVFITRILACLLVSPQDSSEPPRSAL